MVKKVLIVFGLVFSLVCPASAEDSASRSIKNQPNEIKIAAATIKDKTQENSAPQSINSQPDIIKVPVTRVKDKTQDETKNTLYCFNYLQDKRKYCVLGESAVSKYRAGQLDKEIEVISKALDLNTSGFQKKAADGKVQNPIPRFVLIDSGDDFDSTKETYAMYCPIGGSLSGTGWEADAQDKQAIQQAFSDSSTTNICHNLMQKVYEKYMQTNEYFASTYRDFDDYIYKHGFISSIIFRDDYNNDEKGLAALKYAAVHESSHAADFESDLAYQLNLKKWSMSSFIISADFNFSFKKVSQDTIKSLDTLSITSDPKTVFRYPLCVTIYLRQITNRLTARLFTSETQANTNPDEQNDQRVRQEELETSQEQSLADMNKFFQVFKNDQRYVAIPAELFAYSAMFWADSTAATSSLGNEKDFAAWAKNVNMNQADQTKCQQTIKQLITDHADARKMLINNPN